MRSDPPGRNPGVLALSPQARDLYRRICEGGGSVQSVAEEDDEALQVLLHVGLVEHEPVLGIGYLAIDPQVVETRWGLSLQSRAVELLTYAADLPRRVAQLSARYHESHHSSAHPLVLENISDPVQVRLRVQQLVSTCTEELITAQPGTTRGINARGTVQQHEAPMLERGVRRRVLYQPAVRVDPTAREFVEAFTALGGEVRTLDEPFVRAFIFDREAVLLSAPGGPNAAVYSTDSRVVSYVLQTFEQDWQRAQPFDDFAVGHELSSVEEAIIRLLDEGHGQQTIADRLSLSHRTIAAHLAHLRERYRAGSLLQLGYALSREAARRGQADSCTAQE